MRTAKNFERKLTYRAAAYVRWNRAKGDKAIHPADDDFVGTLARLMNQKQKFLDIGAKP